MTSTDIVNSFCGCSGQRCMAASVLLLVEKQPKLLEEIVRKASELKPGIIYILYNYCHCIIIQPIFE